MTTTKRDKIEKLVWYELVHAKYWEQYISDYCGNRMDKRKWFNIITISLALFGGSTWGVWKAFNVEWITPVTFGLLGISQLLSAIQKDIIVSSETLESLRTLRKMYISYFNKLENLFIKIEDKQLSKEEIEEQYFTIRESVYPIEELKDSLNIDQLKKINKIVENRTIKYLLDRYKIENPYNKKQYEKNIN